MKTSKASDAMWDRAIKRVNAESGMGDPADARIEFPSIKSLIASIGKNPAAMELLAVRRHEMTETQITAALRAGLPPKAPKAAPAIPSAANRAARLANIGLYGKSGAPRR